MSPVPRITEMNDDVFDYYEEREDQTRQLAEEEIEEQNQIDEEEENEDPARMCWSNLRVDERRCKTICGFTPREFLEIYDLVEDEIPEKIGRGRRSKTSKFDKLLITLCYLKHYETLDKLKETFSISKTNLFTILESTVKAITPVLYEHFVTDIEERTENEAVDNNQLFPEAKYVMDATFQPIWTPIGTYNEKRRYYSGKHKMYGLKSQCIHDRKGRVVHCVPGEMGSTHDFKICRDHIDELTELLTNEEDEDDPYSVLVDSGYQGLQHLVDAILPHKKQANRPFTRQQRLFNQDLASERVVCERFYGRMKTKFRIMSSKYRNSRDEYHQVFILCVALTNSHILGHPL